MLCLIMNARYIHSMLHNALSLILIMKIGSAAILCNRNNTAFLLSSKDQIMLSRPSFILVFSSFNHHFLLPLFIPKQDAVIILVSFEE